MSRENCRRMGAFSGTSISPSAGSLKITSGGGPICGIGGTSAFLVSSVGLVSAICCPSIQTRPLPFADDPGRFEPRAGVDARADVEIEAPAARPKAGHPDGRVRAAQHEVPLAQARSLRHVAVQIASAELSGHLDALPDVAGRIRARSAAATARLQTACTAIASVTVSATTSPGRGQSPSSPLGQQAIEAERRDAGIFALKASDVPEAGAQLDGTVDGRRPAEDQRNRSLDGRREQHGLIARHEIAAHDDELSLVKARIGEERRRRRRAPRARPEREARVALDTTSATTATQRMVRSSLTCSFDCTYSGWNRYKILVKLAIKRKQLSDQVSELTTNRLSVYLRCLNTLDADGVKTVSSQTLAQQFHLNAAQIRKDLAYFGEFGVRGVGYYVKDLKQHLRQILGLDRRLKVAIFGAGNLGLALADYPGFQQEGFQIAALFDTLPGKVGQQSRAGVPIFDIRELRKIRGARQDRDCRHRGAGRGGPAGRQSGRRRRHQGDSELLAGHAARARRREAEERRSDRVARKPVVLSGTGDE